MSKEIIMNKGAMVRAKQQRDKAIENYMNNPNYCNFCSKIFLPVIKNNRAGIADLKKRKFCNKSCAAKLNNKKTKTKIILCQTCNTKEVPRMARGKVRANLSCFNCIEKDFRRKKSPAKDSPIMKKTKGELFNERKNWQSARSAISKLARRILPESGKEKSCLLCKYSKHVEVAHIKDVRFFNDDVLISVINDISNLVALCRNHHWEHENNELNEEEREKIKNSGKRSRTFTD